MKIAFAIAATFCVLSGVLFLAGGMLPAGFLSLVGAGVWACLAVVEHCDERDEAEEVEYAKSRK